MLSSFTIEGFKSYREATLKLAPLTVLIGANASGKSNAVEALASPLLARAGQQARVNPIRRSGRRSGTSRNGMGPRTQESRRVLSIVPDDSSEVGLLLGHPADSG